MIKRAGQYLPDLAEVAQEDRIPRSYDEEVQVDWPILWEPSKMEALVERKVAEALEDRRHHDLIRKKALKDAAERIRNTPLDGVYAGNCALLNLLADSIERMR